MRIRQYVQRLVQIGKRLNAKGVAGELNAYWKSQQPSASYGLGPAVLVFSTSQAELAFAAVAGVFYVYIAAARLHYA